MGFTPKGRLLHAQGIAFVWHAAYVIGGFCHGAVGCDHCLAEFGAAGIINISGFIGFAGFTGLISLIFTGLSSGFFAKHFHLGMYAIFLAVVGAGGFSHARASF